MTDTPTNEKQAQLRTSMMAERIATVLADAWPYASPYILNAIDAALAPLLAAVAERVKAGHNSACAKGNAWPKSGNCTCGHDQLLAILPLLETRL